MSKPKKDRSVDIPDEIIRKLLTDSEMRMVKQRFLIINLLEDGLTIRQIATKVSVGTDTVVRVARMAERKLKKTFAKKRSERKFKTSTPWIFGKSG